MMFERFGILFWLAVAVLASRVVLEISRWLRIRLGSTAPLVAAHPRGSQVIFVVPTAAEADPVTPQPAVDVPPDRNRSALVPNLLETMSHDEMDRLLKPWA